MSDALELLHADGVIDEILGRIKSGKEATISMVRRGDLVLAAKVYKDRATRSFKNNVEYKEGRRVRNTRTQRAMDRGGKFGRDAAEQAWKSAEADALYRLVDSGVRVPTPVMFYEGVLLMELVLDRDGRPAPRLEEVTLEREAVLGVYCDLLSQLIALLCCDLVHGDLSPYNILLAADGPTIIDFPQVISAAHNARAEHFFLRDFQNVHAHLAAIDPALWIRRFDGRAIWQAYVRRDLTPQFVPPTPPPQALGPRRGGERPMPRPPRPSPPPPPPAPARSRDADYRASPPRPKPPTVEAIAKPRPVKSTALYSHWTGQDPKPANGRPRRDDGRPSAHGNRDPRAHAAHPPRSGSVAPSSRPAPSPGTEPSGQRRRRRRR